MTYFTVREGLVAEIFSEAPELHVDISVYESSTVEIGWPVNGSTPIDHVIMREYYIDVDGGKHFDADAGRVALNCAWSDRLMSDNGIWAVETLQDRLRATLSYKRWQVETSGIIVNGLIIPTDDRAKTLIEGGAATLGDADTTKFKTANGWIDLTGIELRAIRDAISTHVQACFSLEATIDADITSGIVSTTDQINNASWPS